MAQATDFTLSNQAFGSFRTELNSVLSAVNSCQSGTTTPPSAVAGTIWLDTTSATTPTLKYYDGADNISLATIDHSANTVNWLDSAVSITGLTTTATGTVLTLSDTNLNSTVSIRIPTSKGIDDDSGNEFLKFTKTASAVNEFTIINSATGNAPEIQATGGDTNIDLKITPKGSGKINLDGIKFPNADGSANQALVTDGSGSLSFATIATFNTPLAVVGNATAGSEIRLPEDTDNGSNYVALKAPNTIASNLTLTLPSADGTANQLLKTDGSGNLSFVTPSAGFSGATTTSSAVDITLTSASNQVQNVEMTAFGKAVILPDATTLSTKGSPIYMINNIGGISFNIKNNAGYNMFIVPASQTVLISLNDNASSSGKWASNKYPSFIGWSDYSEFNTTSGATSVASYTMNGFMGITASKINSTSAVVSYQKGTSNRDVYARVISYSGSTITVNSETILYDGSSTASENNFILMLSTTAGFLFVARASNMLVVPFTISGTSITAGTASSTFGVASNAGQSQLGNAIAMTSTEAILCDRNHASNATFSLRNIIHNGASAPTIGTASSSITTDQIDFYPLGTAIDSTNAFFYYQVAGITNARVVTISGASAPTLGTANSSSGIGINFTTDPYGYTGGHYPYKVSATEFIVIGGATQSSNYTVSGTTVTFVSNSTNWKRYAKQFVINGAVMGDYIIGNTNGNTIQGVIPSFGAIAIYKKVGSHIFPAFTNVIPLGQSRELLYAEKVFGFDTQFGNQTSFITPLDSTTALGITNDYYQNTCSATIFKLLA